jgi:hypothetical protein
MRKSYLTIRSQTVLVVAGLSVLVEIFPVFLGERYEKENRIFYAGIAIYITVLLENYFNYKKFKQSLLGFIQQLKIIRITHEIKSDGIQAIMNATTTQIAGLLEQKDRLEEEYDSSLIHEDKKNYCSICNKNHVSNSKSKCKNCKLDLEFWKKAEKR